MIYLLTPVEIHGLEEVDRSSVVMPLKSSTIHQAPINISIYVVSV